MHGAKVKVKGRPNLKHSHDSLFPSLKGFLQCDSLSRFVVFTDRKRIQRLA